MYNRGYILMSANGRCPLSMSAIGRFFHNEFIVVHSGLQLFCPLFGGVRYSSCPLIGGFTVSSFVLLVAKFRFTCGELNLYRNSKFKTIIPMIVRKFFVPILRRLEWFKFLEAALFWLNTEKSIEEPPPTAYVIVLMLNKANM